MAYSNSMFGQEASDADYVVGYFETRKYLAFLRYFGRI